jgi:hypothetical protein
VNPIYLSRSLSSVSVLLHRYLVHSLKFSRRTRKFSALAPYRQFISGAGSRLGVAYFSEDLEAGYQCRHSTHNTMSYSIHSKARYARVIQDPYSQDEESTDVYIERKWRRRFFWLLAGTLIMAVLLIGDVVRALRTAPCSLSQPGIQIPYCEIKKHHSYVFRTGPNYCCSSSSIEIC